MSTIGKKGAGFTTSGIENESVCCWVLCWIHRLSGRVIENVEGPRDGVMTPIYLLGVEFCTASVNRVRLTLSLVDFLRAIVLVPFPSNHAGRIIRFFNSECSLPASTSFDILPPSEVRGFLVERIIVSLIFARTAAASASSRTLLPSLSFSSSSSSS